MKKLFLVAALLAAVAFVPQTASAGIITVGDPFSVGSWAQGFNESGVGPYNKMELFSLSGLGFEAPAFSGLAAGWTASGVNPGYFLATGSAISDMTFNLLFNGTSATPLAFDFLAWSGNTVLERAHAVWNGGWTITTLALGPGDYDRAAVPEPATLTLLGLGLVGIARAARRRK